MMAEIINNIIIITIIQNLSKFSSLSEESRKEIVNNKDNVTSRFLNNNVGFFNLFYNDKLSDIKIEIKYVKKKTYFRDIIIFINKIKNVIKIKNVELLRNNFQIYF